MTWKIRPKKQATKENNNVTLEDVKMAIYTLRKEGVSVSVLSIRNKLGKLLGIWNYHNRIE